jgi:hypothetical protein
MGLFLEDGCGQVFATTNSCFLPLENPRSMDGLLQLPRWTVVSASENTLRAGMQKLARVFPEWTTGLPSLKRTVVKAHLWV